jgi:hypothetical protein
MQGFVKSLQGCVITMRGRVETRGVFSFHGEVFTFYGGEIAYPLPTIDLSMAVGLGKGILGIYLTNA